MATFMEFLVEDNRKHPPIKKKKWKAPPAPPKPKPRPNKNLWFTANEFWREDLRMEKGTDIAYHEDEEENIYATDSEGENCYGYWSKKKNGGMTFAKDKPFNHYCNGRCMNEIK